jgi:hypothetical protein
MFHHDYSTVVLEPTAVRSAPFRTVPHRSGTYTSRLEMAHFDGPKFVDVRQRSPVGVNIAVKAVRLCLFLHVNMRWGVALSSLGLLGVASQSG